MDYDRKELVDWVRGIYQNLDDADKQDALRFFHELRESENEKMIRVIGLALTDVPEERFTSLGITLKDCLAYLEKQKKREIEVKNCRLRDAWEYVDEFIKKFGRIPKDVDELSACADYVIKHKSIDEKEQKPRDHCSVRDEFDLDGNLKQKSVVTHGETYHVDTLGTQQVIAGKMPQKPIEWGYDNKIQYDSVKSGIEAFASTYSFNIESKLFPQLTKEQQQLWKEEIEQAVIAGGENGIELARDNRCKENKTIEWNEDDEQYLLICKNALQKYQQSNQWDANIISDWLEKHLKSSYQPKQEWSKEDELMRTAVIQTLERFGGRGTTGMQIDWLKFLRPKPHWKPSEEQIEAVRYFVNKHQSEAWAATGQWKQFTALRGLWGDLLKLM